MTREEAIEIVKKHGISADGTKFESALRELIPELRESEDERTRKALIETVKCIYAGDTMFLSEQQRDRYLDWLEKQKEVGIQWLKSDNVKNPDKPYIDKAGMFYTTDGRMCYASDIEKQKEQKSSINIDQLKSLMLQYLQEAANEKDDLDIEADTDKWARKILGYDFEQKPVDLSEMMVHKEPYIAPVPTPMVADEPKPAEVDESTKRLNDNWMRQHFDDCKERNTAMINGEPIPTENYSVNIPLAEWSEENERMLSRCIKSIECSKMFAETKAFKEAKDKEIDWLKSLRPQPKRDCKDCAMFLNGKCTKPHWKPSEEQMEALHRCIYYLHGEGSEYFEPIKSLYEQLKKLM